MHLAEQPSLYVKKPLLWEIKNALYNNNYKLLLHQCHRVQLGVGQTHSPGTMQNSSTNGRMGKEDLGEISKSGRGQFSKGTGKLRYLMT